MPISGHFTAADLATMPDDGQRYELLGGELLVTPSPGGWHQVISARLHAAILPYLQTRGLADQLLCAPADITFGPDTVLEPDLFVADTTAMLRSGQMTDVTRLFLVVEVLSPSTARADRILKRPVYQTHGIPQYWIVDIDERLVEVWTPAATAPMIERARLTWHHPTLEGECVVDLVRLFDLGGGLG